MILLLLAITFYYFDNIKNIYITNLSQYDYKYTLIIGTTLLNLLVYWVISFFFIFIDLYNKPRFITSYKIQSKISPIYNNTKLLFDTSKVVLFNQLVITPIILVIIYYFKSNNIIFPSIYLLTRDLIISLLLTEIFFYYIHRLLHVPFFYKSIHKLHHEYTSPISISALYVHPIEYILGNILPIMIGPIICNSHIFTIWLWSSLAIVNTINAHCGYKIPLLMTSNNHDIHHMKFKYNYGVMNILDYIHGTLYRE